MLFLLLQIFYSFHHTIVMTFILIHGSWHSAWNWHRLIPILEAQGHTAIAMDLPGMGRDKTPMAEVRMQRTVEKICAVIDNIPGKVILVGHSKNGIMVSQVAEYRPDKIAVSVYLAAYLVPDGKTQQEYSRRDTAGMLKPYVVRDESGQWHTLQAAVYKAGLYADCDDGIVELAKLLLGPEPVESGITPLRLTDANFGRVPRVYIACTQDRAVTPFIQQQMYTETPCEKVFHMETSHSPFFSRPQELADILCSLC